jgi:hypothetical protein
MRTAIPISRMYAIHRVLLYARRSEEFRRPVREHQPYIGSSRKQRTEDDKPVAG